MTRLQLARFIRFTLNPSKEDMAGAYYAVSSATIKSRADGSRAELVDAVYKRYSVVQLRTFKKERLVGLIVNYLLDPNTEAEANRPLGVSVSDFDCEVMDFLTLLSESEDKLLIDAYIEYCLSHDVSCHIRNPRTFSEIREQTGVSYGPFGMDFCFWLENLEREGCASLFRKVH
jgi:hypothetical protein